MKLGGTRVYAGKSIDVIVEADRERVLSGIVRMSEEDRTVMEQEFNSPRRSTVIHLQVDEPGDYSIYVEIGPTFTIPLKECQQVNSTCYLDLFNASFRRWKSEVVERRGNIKVTYN